MELWGGIECTLNRVNGRRFDQLARCGHYDRADDLDRIAALGLKTMRYPLLWERAVTASPDEYDWRFADERLARLRALDITPIVGLVHHGSGPDHASVESEAFAPGLASYAGALARRFPWLEWYVPVNEPLTTARFCGLYGHWFPHGHDERVFARILLNQCRATVLAMRAIRAVNPRARLVQTEDLGTIYSTAALAYQANFENTRRWLAWDLLCGRVDVSHPMHAHLVAWGVAPAELAWLVQNRCPPDMIGIDHYVTSDRFLDEDLHRYPRCYWGGNARQRYADVEAVRVRQQPGTSRRAIILEAAQRYGLPVALTEVHIGCTPDEQVRWLHEAWTTCRSLERTGVDVRAMTAWAILGSYDWDSLLTRDRGRFEAGVFELTDVGPRATSVSEFVAGLAAGRDHRAASIVATPGWWRRPERMLYGLEPEPSMTLVSA